MLTTKHGVTIALACIFGLGHGRRLLDSFDLFQDSRLARGQKLVKSDSENLARFLLALDASAAYKHSLPSIHPSRRQVLAATLATAAFPQLAAKADPAAPGQDADTPAPNEITYREFLQSLVDKKVTKVIFMPPNGDEAYAVIGGNEVRVGKDWPVNLANTWSSPLYVQRLLQNEKVPFEWKYAKTFAAITEDLETTKGKDKEYYKKKKEREREQFAQKFQKQGTAAQGVDITQSKNYKTGEALRYAPEVWASAKIALRDFDKGAR